MVSIFAPKKPTTTSTTGNTTGNTTGTTNGTNGPVAPSPSEKKLPWQDNVFIKDPMEDYRRRTQFTPASKLDPADARTVKDLPLPAEGTENAALDFVARAASQLGFSPEVTAEAVLVMQQRYGDELCTDLDTKKPLKTAADFKAADNNGDGLDSYTFDAQALAIFRDVNDAAGLGYANVNELYAAQGQQFAALQDAALSGTDVDMTKALKGINDPNVRTAMIATYDALRGLDELGHGATGSFERMGALKEILAESAAKLPKNHPLGALVANAQERIGALEQQLTAGVKTGGPIPAESMAALNNLAKDTLGKMPDEAQFNGLIERTAEAARANGATDKEVGALKRAMELAYVIRSGQTTSGEGLARAKADLDTAMKDAGRFMPAPVRALLTEAASKGTPNAVDGGGPRPVADNKSLEKVASLAELLKVAAKTGGVSEVEESMDAVKNALDAIEKGSTWEGVAAGSQAATAIFKAVGEIAARAARTGDPALAAKAAQLLGRVTSAFKLPTDVFGAYGNAKKLVTGTDLDGKAVSADERIKAAVDLGLDNAPSIIAGIGAVTGSSALIFEIAAAPPAAIPLLQAKLMLMVLEEAGKMKGNIATHELRKRFNLGDGTDFNDAMAQVTKKTQEGDVSRYANATNTARDLLMSGFSDGSTMARFRAYASQRLGRDNVRALMAGKPLPGPYADPGPGQPDPARAARTIELAKDLKKLALEFMNRETQDTVRMLNEGSGRGSYLDPRERDFWLNK